MESTTACRSSGARGRSTVRRCCSTFGTSAMGLPTAAGGSRPSLGVTPSGPIARAPGVPSPRRRAGGCPSTGIWTRPLPSLAKSRRAAAARQRRPVPAGRPSAAGWATWPGGCWSPRRSRSPQRAARPRRCCPRRSCSSWRHSRQRWGPVTAQLLHWGCLQQRPQRHPEPWTCWSVHPGSVAAGPTVAAPAALELRARGLQGGRRAPRRCGMMWRWSSRP
mmetsp:Transcript_85641/g.266560  ORF Transcript_85641/g.266560 Transcript_85641/m.266560 type:complete len:220 (-) Transcript_85641:632-1291(-)